MPSRQIPINEVELTSFDLPVFTSHAEAATILLGGTNHVQHVLRGGCNDVNLFLRPSDPYHNPIRGVPHSVNNFLLFIPSQRQVAHERGLTQKRCTADVYVRGRITNTYRWKELADFQFIPTKVPLQVDGELLTKFVQQFDKGQVSPSNSHLFVSAMYNGQNNSYDASTFGPSDWANVLNSELTVPPLRFSRFSTPVPFDFRDPVSIGKAHQQEGASFLQYEFTDDFAPPIDSIEIKLDGRHSEMLLALQQAFVLRPIWTQSALSCYLDVPQSHFRHLLTAFAYFSFKGPYHRCWIRLGYDPRKESVNWLYQTLNLSTSPSDRLHITALEKHFADYLPLNVGSVSGDDTSELDLAKSIFAIAPWPFLAGTRLLLVTQIQIIDCLLFGVHFERCLRDVKGHNMERQLLRLTTSERGMKLLHLKSQISKRFKPPVDIQKLNATETASVEPYKLIDESLPTISKTNPFFDGFTLGIPGNSGHPYLTAEIRGLESLPKEQLKWKNTTGWLSKHVNTRVRQTLQEYYDKYIDACISLMNSHQRDVKSTG